LNADDKGKTGGSSGDFPGEFSLLIRARYGLILLRTIDEDRAETLLRLIADRMNLPFYAWTADRGLRRDGADEAVYGTAALVAGLAHIEASQNPALYHFQGVASLFAEGVPRDPVLDARLLTVAKKLGEREGALVLTGDEIPLSDACRRHAAVIRLPAPSEKEYSSMLGEIVRDLSRRMHVRVDLTRRDAGRLIKNLRGLTLFETRKILTTAILDEGCLSASSVGRVLDAKKSAVERDGLLEFHPAGERFHDIADLTHLKEWLSKRRHFLEEPEKAVAAGLSFPKGILLLGVPGSGKSLCAKAVSNEWGIPLLKMDPSRLYSKYIGETERNFRRAMDAAELMAPVVLWVDEIEKALASGGEEDGGVSKRVLGGFLGWMQERRGDVFLVATANDIGRLPPELLRKGRLDEIFFVDLPDAETREQMFRIHIGRRRRSTDGFDYAALAAAAEGFTGAEIEQAICSALYSAVPDGGKMTTESLLREIRSTRPISKTRAEEIRALREWARERTVPAN
jgi:hypothetical protein